MSDPDRALRAVDINRLNGRLLVLGLLLYAVPVALQLHAQADQVALWWNLVFLLLVLLAGPFALVGLDRRAAWLLWLATVAGAVTLPWAVTGLLDSPSWLAMLSPVAAGVCVLVSRRTWVCALALVAILVAGSAAHSVLVPAPPRVTVLKLVYLVAVWAGALAVRRTLEYAHHRVDGVQDAAVAEYVAARASEATVRAEQTWDAYLHDEVVSALVAVADGGTESARVRAGEVLDAARERGLRSVPTPWIGAGSLDSVLQHRPDAETFFDIDPQAEVVPEEVRRAVLEALNEALRNVGRHAYGPTGEGPVRVAVSLDETGVRAVVSDEGHGFDPAAVPDSRLGISVSIQARMDAVGGRAVVDSEPGAGTRVELLWTRPSAVRR